jgi:hypothetical protein
LELKITSYFYELESTTDQMIYEIIFIARNDACLFI